MNEQSVIVMGRNYTSLLGMVRSAGQAGYEVHVIKTVREKSHMVKTPEGYSKYVKTYGYAVEPNRDSLINAVKAVKYNGKAILLPTDDFTAAVIDECKDILEDRFLFPGIICGGNSITYYMDKNRQNRIARETGINTPLGCTILIKDGMFEIPKEVSYPCFTKPLISLSGNKTYMKKCDSKNELEDLLIDIARKTQGKCPILVEQYLDIKHEYALQGCCLDSIIVIPGAIKKIRVARGKHQGVTAVGQVIKASDLDIYEKIIEFMKKFHFVGVFDIELIESDDKLFFNELNLRSGAYGYSITYTGVNLPQILVEYLSTGKVISNAFKVIPGAVFVSEKVELEDYSSGYLDWRTYKKEIKESDFQLIYDKEDYAPYKVFKRTVLKQRIKRFIRR